MAMGARQAGALLAGLVVSAGIGAWLLRPAGPPPAGQVAPDAPLQVLTPEAGAPTFRLDGASATALASYDMTALVLSTHRYKVGRTSGVSPVDFAVGWGPMSDRRTVSELRVRQGNRWFSYGWRGRPPLAPETMALHAANVHIVPLTESVRRAALDVSAGQRVRVRGHLVRIQGDTGWTWSSSLSRSDTGDGACELLLATSIEASAP